MRRYIVGAFLLAVASCAGGDEGTGAGTSPDGAGGGGDASAEVAPVCTDYPPCDPQTTSPGAMTQRPSTMCPGRVCTNCDHLSRSSVDLAYVPDGTYVSKCVLDDGSVCSYTYESPEYVGGRHPLREDCF